MLTPILLFVTVVCLLLIAKFAPARRSAGRPMSTHRLVIVLALCALAVVAWVFLMQAAYASFYIEPTDDARARAQAAVQPGITAAGALVAVAAAIALVSRRPLMAVVGLPGLVAGSIFIFVQDSASSTLVYGFLGTFIAAIVLAIDGIRRLKSSPRS
jgi:hypothetical protein